MQIGRVSSLCFSSRNLKERIGSFVSAVISTRKALSFIRRALLFPVPRHDFL